MHFDTWFMWRNPWTFEEPRINVCTTVASLCIMPFEPQCPLNIVLLYKEDVWWLMYFDLIPSKFSKTLFFSLYCFIYSIRDHYTVFDSISGPLPASTDETYMKEISSWIHSTVCMPVVHRSWWGWKLYSWSSSLIFIASGLPWHLWRSIYAERSATLQWRFEDQSVHRVLRVWMPLCIIDTTECSISIACQLHHWCVTFLGEKALLQHRWSPGLEA